MNTTKTPDHKPTTRFRPKRKLGTQFRSKIARFHSRICELQDDTPSSTVVRWLIVLLLFHIVAIGGVWVHGTCFKDRTQTVDIVSLPTPPSVAQTPAVNAVTAPAITQTVDQQTTAPASAQPAAPVTITQPNQVVDARPATPVAPPAVITPAPTPAVKPVPGPARHLVRTGDTWETIAKDNNVSVADLKAVNPGANAIAGVKLVIPARPGEVVEPVKPVEQPKPNATEHIVKKNETLSSIGRKHKIDWRKIQKFNNMSDKDVSRIKPGQKILIPAK